MPARNHFKANPIHEYYVDDCGAGLGEKSFLGKV
jgi:hypothetical protein